MVSTERTRDEIKAGIKAKSADVRKCYEQALLSNPKLVGKVNAHIVIGADGTVTQATADAGDGMTAEVATCVADVLKTATFSAAAGVVSNVDYPFVFDQTGDDVGSAAP